MLDIIYHDLVDRRGLETFLKSGGEVWSQCVPENEPSAVEADQLEFAEDGQEFGDVCQQNCIDTYDPDVLNGKEVLRALIELVNEAGDFATVIHSITAFETWCCVRRFSGKCGSTNVCLRMWSMISGGMGLVYNRFV